MNLAQFYPEQADFPESWSFEDRRADSEPVADTTKPKGCRYETLFPCARRSAESPDGALLTVQVFRPPQSAGLAIQAIRDWARRCSSFTVLGGGTTGKTSLSVAEAQPPAASVSEAAAHLVTGQGPFVRPQLHLAAAVRGVCVIVSQQAGDKAAEAAYLATVDKIDKIDN